MMGIDRKTGLAWANDMTDASGRSFRERKELAKLRGPLALEDMDVKAQKAIDDFEYFRRAHFGRLSSPWQLDAAYQLDERYDSPVKEFINLNCPPGGGKALALDTPLPTPTGWTTMGDVAVGDRLLDVDGKPCTVVAKSQVFQDHDCFEVRSDDGASVIADADHLWPTVLDRKTHPVGTTRSGHVRTLSTTGPKPTDVHVATTRSLARTRTKRPLLPTSSPVNLVEANLLIDPYVFGVWLGDGDSAGGRVTAVPDDAKYIRAEIESAGYITTDHKCLLNFGVLGLQRQLRALGVLNNKHVPNEYLWASANQRLALLQGLIDTDGHVDPRGRVEFCSTNLALAEAAQHLAISLGVKASLKESRATLKGQDISARYRVAFMLEGAARLPRKAVLTRNGVRTPNRYLTVTPVESVPVQCVQVDSPTHLYLAGTGMMVTHNSTLLHDFEAWQIAKRRAIRMMLGSSTQRNANKYSGRLRRTLERSRPEFVEAAAVAAGRAVEPLAAMAAWYGRFQPDTNDLWRQEEFIVAQIGDIAIGEKEPTVQAYGLDTEFIGNRVDLSVWDDVVTKRLMRTLDAIEKQRDVWDNEAETRIEPGGLLALVGQRLGMADLYAYCKAKLAGEDVDLEDFDDNDDPVQGYVEIDAQGSKVTRMYHSIIYPAHDDEKCRSHHSTKNPRYWTPDDEEACLLDPIRLPYRELRQKQLADDNNYQTVYQQKDVGKGGVLVPRHYITGGEVDGVQFPGCYDKDRMYHQVPSSLNWDAYSIVTVDPSHENWWAIQWWLYDHTSSLRFLMDSYRNKLQSDDFLYYNPDGPPDQKYFGVLEDLWQLSNRLGRPFKYLIVEQNGAQRYLLRHDFFNRWAALRSVSVHPHDTTNNKSDPEYGVQTIASHYRFGRIRLPNSAQHGDLGHTISRFLVDEVTQYPDGTTTDQVMAHWFLEYWIPRIVTPAPEDIPLLARPTWA